MAVPDFSNVKNAEAWLKTKPQEVGVAIASRAALRCLPFFAGLTRTDFGKKTPAEIILPLVRAVLMSAVRVLNTEGEVSEAADAAFNAARSAYFPLGSTGHSKDRSRIHAASSATFAAESAIRSVAYSTTSAVRSVLSSEAAAVNTASAGRSATGAAHKDASAMDNDGPRDLANRMSKNLWAETVVPWALSTALDQDWNTLKAWMERQPTPWTFWIAFYESHRDGGPKDWALHRRIALIPDDEWKNVDGVNAKINEWYEESLKPEPATTLAEPLSSDYARASLTDFGFEQARALLVHLGFEDDIPALDDPALIDERERRLRNLRRLMEDFWDDLDGETNAPRGIKSRVPKYLDEAQKGLSNPDPLRRTDPSRLWDLGAYLLKQRRNENVCLALGEELTDALDQVCEAHETFMQSSFLPALRRLHGADTVAWAEGVDEAEIFSVTNTAFERVRAPGALLNDVALDPELSALLAEVREGFQDRYDAFRSATHPDLVASRQSDYRNYAKLANITLQRMVLRTAQKTGVDINTLGSVASILGLASLVMSYPTAIAMGALAGLLAANMLDQNNKA